MLVRKKDKEVKELILIIEDNDLLRSIFFDFLELENYNVISAEDGYRGLHLAKKLKPDLILCDINMPNLDGYEVLKKLRDDFSIAETPFIFITSQTDSNSYYRALQLGANDYLIKPISMSQLLEAIANQFKQQVYSV
jgi:DNA-binding response OmpR family regulator